MSKLIEIDSWDDPLYRYVVKFNKICSNSDKNITTEPIRIFKYQDGKNITYSLDYGTHSVTHYKWQIKSITRIYKS